MAHPCDARSISTCADFRQTIRSAYLILRFRYIYLSPLPSLPLPLSPCHVTPYVCVCYWLWGESVSGSTAMLCDVVAYLWFVSGSFRIGKFAFWFFFFTCSLQLCLPACCLCCPLAVAHVVFIRKFFSFLLRHTRHTFPLPLSLSLCVCFMSICSGNIFAS